MDVQAETEVYPLLQTAVMIVLRVLVTLPAGQLISQAAPLLVRLTAMSS